MSSGYYDNRYLLTPTHGRGALYESGDNFSSGSNWQSHARFKTLVTSMQPTNAEIGERRNEVEQLPLLNNWLILSSVPGVARYGADICGPWHFCSLLRSKRANQQPPNVTRWNKTCYVLQRSNVKTVPLRPCLLTDRTLALVASPKPLVQALGVETVLAGLAWHLGQAHVSRMQDAVADHARLNSLEFLHVKTVLKYR